MTAMNLISAYFNWVHKNSHHRQLESHMPRWLAHHLHLHPRHISIYFIVSCSGPRGVPQEARPFQTNPNEWLGPCGRHPPSTLEQVIPAHSRNLTGLALRLPKGIVKVLQHCIVLKHLETLKENKMLLRLIHLDQFDPTAYCSIWSFFDIFCLLNLGFSAQHSSKAERWHSRPMTSRLHL